MSIYHFSDRIANECNNTISAILFHHILYWVEMNKKNGKMNYDNKFWVYQSYAQFQKRFDYLSKSQIRFSLEKLEQNQLIISTNKYNDSENCGIFNNTKWYTVTEEGYKVLGDDIKYVMEQIQCSEKSIKQTNNKKMKQEINKRLVEEIIGDIEII